MISLTNNKSIKLSSQLTRIISIQLCQIVNNRFYLVTTRECKILLRIFNIKSLLIWQFLRKITMRILTNRIFSINNIHQFMVKHLLTNLQWMIRYQSSNYIDSTLNKWLWFNRIVTTITKDRTVVKDFATLW